jgi:sugar phosphate isomerase/epimerase
MRLAYNSVAFHHSALDDVIPLLQLLGYDAIELNAETLPWASPHVTPTMGREERHQLKQLLRRSSLSVSSISAHINLIPPDALARRNAVAFVKGCIDLASDLETAVVHGLSGSPAEGLPRALAWEWLMTALHACLEHATARGVTFALEPVVNMLVCDSHTMRRLQEDMADSRLKVNFDPSHLQVHGDDPARAVRDLGPTIVHVHIKDAAGTPEKYEFPPLGMGRVDFESVLRGLGEVGYDGFVSIEYEANAFGYPGEPHEIARESRRFIEEIARRAIGGTHWRSRHEQR